MRRQVNDRSPGVCLHTQPSSIAWMDVQVLFFLNLAEAAALQRWRKLGRISRFVGKWAEQRGGQSPSLAWCAIV